jgi:hypothetical protein
MDFFGCWLVNVRCPKSGGDEDAAELGEHVCGRWLGLGGVPGCAGAVIGDVGGVVPGGGVPGGGDGRLPAGCGWLDQACLYGQAGQVGAAPAAGLVPDPVQVGADGADADVQPLGDLGVGGAAGDQDDQFPFPGR